MFNGLDYSMSLNMSMAFFHLFWGFPAARSRVVIRLAKGTKAKPNANTRTLRPDKCLVVRSLYSSLRPAALRNMESTAITTRGLKARRESHFLGVNCAVRCRGEAKIRLPFYSLYRVKCPLRARSRIFLPLAQKYRVE